jgi:hypothetical protein
MEKEKTGLYSIENFNTEKGLGILGLGQYGVKIVLDGDVVKSLSSFERDDNSPLMAMLKDRLQSSIPDCDQRLAHLEFYRDSWLLVGMHIGANCACFSIDGNTRARIESGEFQNIAYSSHNIDSSVQAAVIVSVWLLWFNTILTCTPFELPYAM